MTLPDRSRLLAVVGVAVLLVAAPVVATAGPLTGPAESPYEDKLSGPAETVADPLFGYATPDWLATYGPEADARWYVSIENGSYGALETWANTSARRDLVRNTSAPDAEGMTVLVEAPPADVLGGVRRDGWSVTWPDGVQSRDYVRHIGVVAYVDRDPVPVSATDEVYERPDAHTLVRGTWSPDGLAFDRNASTLEEAANVTGVNATSVNATGTTVAVLDTGLNVDNTSDPAAYGDRVVAAKNFVAEGEPTGLANVNTTNLHGPWTVAAVGANTTNDSYDGVCPTCDLVVGKTLDDDGSGSTEDIRRAILWAEEQGADIISLSLGSPVYSPELTDAIRTACAGNVTAVYIAAGNSRMRPAAGRYVNSPADAPVTCTVTVGATDVAAPANASSAYFSSVGPDPARDLSNGVTLNQSVDVAAPGMAVTAPVWTQAGYRQNRTLSGTSMSTPIAAGIGGLMHAAHPDLENDSAAFTAYVRNTSEPVKHAGRTEVGAGLVDAERAVALNATETSQSAVRVTEARARDRANRNYAANPGFWAQLFDGLSLTLSVEVAG